MRWSYGQLTSSKNAGEGGLVNGNSPMWRSTIYFAVARGDLQTWQDCEADVNPARPECGPAGSLGLQCLSCFKLVCKLTTFSAVQHLLFYLELKTHAPQPLVWLW